MWRLSTIVAPTTRTAERSSSSGRAALALLVCLVAVLLAETTAFAPVASHSTPPVACTRQLSRQLPDHKSRQQQSSLQLREGLFEEGAVVETATTDAVGVISDETNEQEQEAATYQTAFRNTILSIAAALVFGAGLWVVAGPTVGEEFFAGYLVEKSLSVDNLFVFLLLFDFFQVPPQYQNRVLSWGIYGSVVMRSIMIGLGAAALQHFHAILLVFAGILIYSAIQVLVDVEEFEQDKDEELRKNPVIRFSRFICDARDTCDLEEYDQRGLANPVVMFSRSLVPSTDAYDGDRFFTMERGVKKATPLFMCMIAVELSDVVFAVDSIPAVFGVTEDPFVVFSSNMFAILGLRSLYPVLSRAVNDLKYLEPAVAVILAFIGGKMIAEYFGYNLPTETALMIIVSLLGIGVGASMWEKQREQGKQSLKDD